MLSDQVVNKMCLYLIQMSVKLAKNWPRLIIAHIFRQFVLEDIHSVALSSTWKMPQVVV